MRYFEEEILEQRRRAYNAEDVFPTELKCTKEELREFNVYWNRRGIVSVEDGGKVMGVVVIVEN